MIIINLKELIFKLSEADGMGGIKDALRVAEQYLSQYATVEYMGEGTLIGFIKGNSNHTIMLDAHIDEIGMMVTAVDEKGFLKVSGAGGIDARILAAMPVRIHAKEPVVGVFCSTPPHLRKDDEEICKITEMYIDTGLGEKGREVVSVGDRVTFLQAPKELTGGRITGKSFDDRAGVAALIEVAHKISDQGVPLCNVAILLSDQEELGCRGAKVSAFAVDPDEAIAVDVSFGDTPDIPSHKTGKLDCGAMLGVSPVLSQKITDKLAKLATENKIPFQYEVMGGHTSTNADVIAVTRSGIPCGLLSIPLRNMHTPVEVISIADVQSVADMITAYIMAYDLEKQQ